MARSVIYVVATVLLVAAGCSRSGFKEYPFKVSKKDPNLQMLIGTWEYLTLSQNGTTRAAAQVGSPMITFGERGFFTGTANGDTVQLGTWAVRGDTIYTYLEEVELRKMIIEQIDSTALIFKDEQTGYMVTGARITDQTR